MKLLGSQITDKSKKGFGYSAVPQPHPLIYNRPNKLDLSYSGLDEFKEPEFKGYGPENSKKESNVVCENQSDAPIIEDWVSDDEEQDESKTKPEKKTVITTAAKIEKPVKKSVSKKPGDSTAGEAVTTTSIDDSAVPTTNEEITLAQTLIQIKAAKPKVVTTAVTTAITTRPKDRGVVVQEPSEFRVPQEIQPLSSKDKGKGIMIKPEVPLKRKDQIALDEQIARDIQAKLDVELLEEQKLARKQEEANIALIESW
ncbi:hypothetical protein Tco_0815808 [Tanacetum coccineum]